MFAVQMYRDPIQRAVCLLLAAFIVSFGLASGTIGLQALERSSTAAAAAKNAEASLRV